MFEAPLSREKLDEILMSLRTGLEDLMGEQLVAVYLYSSQARGDARPDSDIDVLIVLREDFDYFEMLNRTSHLTAALSLEHDTVISCVFVSQGDYENRRTPLLKNIRKEGVLA